MDKELTTVLFSLGFVGLLLLIAVISAFIFANKLSGLEKAIFVWYFYDALTHLVMEACFVWMSVTGTVETNNTNPLSEIWKEYGKADSRWLVSESCVVSVEIITVVLAGPLCVLLLYLVSALSERFNYLLDGEKLSSTSLLAVLCVCEIYGGWMTFGPEWISGCKSLNTSNPLYLWIYLTLANGVWVVVPLLLLWQSYNALVVNDNKLKTN